MLRWVSAGAASMVLWAASDKVIRVSGRAAKLVWLYVVTGAQG
ncbi:MAG: hypothetical protein ABIS06_12500 [Vicinamibacterales bacterium]